MKKYSYTKSLAISIIILFFCVSILPNISGNAVVEINNHNVIYPQKINSRDKSLISFRRIYCFGPIYNLTIENNTKYCEFESNNLRMLRIDFSNIGDWGIWYYHFTYNNHYTIVGYRFRGILKPSFICGYFFYRNFLSK